MKSRLLVKLDILHDLVLDDRADEIVESAMDYLLSYQKTRLQRELSITEEQLANFRSRFQMSDHDFIKLYENAELEDRSEFLEWVALLSLESNIQQKLTLVKKALVMQEQVAAVL